MAILDGSEFNAGQYGPQSVFDRGRVGMMAEFRGGSADNAIQTLQMNDQLMRKREQEMELAALEVQRASQDAQSKMKADEAKRLAAIATGVQEHLATNGQYIKGLIDSGNKEGYANHMHALGQALQATPEELNKAAPFGDPTAMTNYASQAQASAGYGYVHDEKSLSDKDVEREKSRLTEGRDVRGDIRQEGISQRKVQSERVRKDIVSMGGDFTPKTVKEVYNTGMSPEAVNASVTVARSTLTKILKDSDLIAKDVKNKQQGGIEIDSLSYRYGVALQQEYNKMVDTDTRAWEALSPGQRLITPQMRPKTPSEYQRAALEEVVSMTTLGGEPQKYVTKALEKDRKIFVGEMLRSPDPQIQDAVASAKQMISGTEAYGRLGAALDAGQVSEQEVQKIESEMIEEVLIKMYYGKPVIRGLVKGSEFTRSTKSNRPRGGQMQRGR